MTCGTIQTGVSTLERPKLVMIKYGSLPGDSPGPMAGHAVGRKPGSLMIGIGSSIVFSHVTPGALLRSPGILAVFVAITAVRGFVLAV